MRLGPTRPLTMCLMVVLAACTADRSSPEPFVTGPPSTASASATQGGVPDAARAEIQAALATTLDEEVVWINKHVAFEGSTEIPDGATAFAGGQASLEDTRRARLMVQFADVPEALAATSMEVILDGSLVYLRGRVIDPYLPIEGTWLLVDLGSDDPAVEPFAALATGHNDASTALFYLYGVTRVLDVADDTVHEQAARRYSVEIDLDAALGAIPAQHRDGMEDGIAAMTLAGVSRELRAEVWVGADGLVHHIDYVQPLGPKLGGGEMTASVDFSDFGVPLMLDLPPEIHITRIEDVDGPAEQLPRA